MGKVIISINVEEGKGGFGCQIDHATLQDLCLASAKLDIMKSKLTNQIEQAMNAQSQAHFEK